MTLISFISIPITTLDGETKTIKIDLNNDKLFPSCQRQREDNNIIRTINKLTNNNISDIDIKRWNDIIENMLSERSGSWDNNSRTCSCDTPDKF